MWSSRCGWGVGCDGNHRYSDLVGSKTRPIVMVARWRHESTPELRHRPASLVHEIG